MNESAKDALNWGPQRVDALLRSWGIENHDMVLAAAPEQLTHKQVQRARSGRRLTLSMMQKIARVLNAAVLERLDAEAAESFTPYMHRDLFSYAKNYDEAWVDPNASLYPR
ncbi:MAG: hypothetical protein J1E42_03475 [Akkermansiaceae bacterium]|nr:hypothetical protein [Akkermansiaceae bacterium]